MKRRENICLLFLVLFFSVFEKFLNSRKMFLLGFDDSLYIYIYIYIYVKVLESVNTELTAINDRKFLAEAIIGPSGIHTGGGALYIVMR